MMMRKYSFWFWLILTLLSSCAAIPAPDLGRTPTLAHPAPPTDADVTPQAVTGVTYYVALDGSDTANDGSETHPWRTIQYAVEQLAPGDTVLVKSGTYTGARLESSGTVTAPLMLKAAPDATVIINGPGPENAHQSGLEIENWDAPVAYWIIEGLEVTGAPGWGIDIRGSEEVHAHHITVRGNHVHDNGLSSGRTGIFAAFTDDVLIENNATHHNGEHGIYVNNSSDRFVIRGNVSYHNVYCGIHLNGDAEMGGDGVLSDGQVTGNTLYENGTGGGSAINMDGVSGTLVANNLIYAHHATGIALFQENGAVCSSDNRVVHNTVLIAADGRWAMLVAAADCTGNVILNNIFYSDHSYRGSINVPADLSALVSDYNVVVDRFTTDDGDSIMTLAEWQTRGFDAHSFLATPAALFVDAAAHDYRLRAGSPAVDVGSAEAGITADHAGDPRPYGAGYDIGAFELQAETPFTPTATVFLPLVTATPSAPPVSAGHITYRLGDRLYRLATQEGATSQDVSAVSPLDAIHTWKPACSRLARSKRVILGSSSTIRIL
ncbi:MAG: right-handed parallel beta-helix repeat-containing protein [Anaerolineae bacterium]|nr:right-handed parallel beta-helix repeat-containing protein [Anaerolineae bacterium]